MNAMPDNDDLHPDAVPFDMPQAEARIRLARLCIDHALAEWPAVQVAPDA